MSCLVDIFGRPVLFFFEGRQRTSRSGGGEEKRRRTGNSGEKRNWLGCNVYKE